MYQKRNIKLEIVGLFLGDYNRQFYLREISKLTKIPLKTTQNTLQILEKNKLLNAIPSGKNKYFKLNLNNIQTKFCLLEAEIYKTKTFLEVYPVFKIFLKELKINIPIIIFGSFAKLKADKNSDLDLLIISKDERTNLPFHLLPFTVQKINLLEISFIKAVEKKETLIKEIEENHVILNNHSFYVNTMWDFYAK